MRQTRIAPLLLSLLLASTPALAAAQNETARLEWRDTDHHLVVDASNGIVRVTTTEPDGYFGVRSGDRILRVDGRPVRRIDDVSEVLARSSRTRLPVTVLRRGSEATVEVNTAAWRNVVPVDAPAPPAPPPPPSPRG